MSEILSFNDLVTDIDYKKIYFSQETVAHNVHDYAKNMYDGHWNYDKPVTALDLGNGQMILVDNRRVLAGVISGKLENLNIKIFNPNDRAIKNGEFLDCTWGEYILKRRDVLQNLTGPSTVSNPNMYIRSAAETFRS